MTAIGLAPVQSHAQNTPLAVVLESTTGISLTVSAEDGSYSIHTPYPGGSLAGWSFGGSVGQPVGSLTVASGQDRLGTFQKISFEYVVNGGPREASIRTYAGRPIVLFSTKLLAAGANNAVFPSISRYPSGLNKFGFNFVYDYRFGPSGQGPASPWLYFDRDANSFIVSPASHFPVAYTSQDANGAIMAGINPAIAQLPAGFTQETLLMTGQGINNIWDRWGRAMTDLAGKIRPTNHADPSLTALSYWTDAASQYYYAFVPGLGYEGTLQAVKADFARHGIQIRAMQLDSFWYPKGDPGGKPPSWANSGAELGNGQYVLEPDQAIFPDGLSGLEQRLDGIPLFVHARWIDPTSPYRQQYAMSGNVSIDPQYWNDRAAELKRGGVKVYEQDWMASWAQTRMNASDPEVYLDLMARAMANAGIALQYCGARVGQVLQGTKYGNLTTMRVSPDGFNRSRWDYFLYTSRLATSAGIWPWADNVYSGDVKSLLLETLSAGPVGVGDAIGEVNPTNLLQSVRPDGIIVKPDVPIVPMDSTYAAEAAAQAGNDPPPPMLASTYTDHEGVKTFYVFGYSRSTGGASATIAFTPRELGIQQQAYVYNYFTHAGRPVDADEKFTDSVDVNGSYYLVAPVGPSRIAFLGDNAKFASAGLERFPGLEDSGILTASIEFAEGERSVVLQGYSPVPVMVVPHRGSIRGRTYDPVTHLFTITVSPAREGRARVSVSTLGPAHRGNAAIPPKQ